MLCNYINLASRTDKKILIERSFEVNKIEGWTLRRFEAIDKVYVENKNIAGSLPSAEKGCFLSHQFIINNAEQTEGHLFIVEDDVVFGKNTFSIIDNIIQDIDHPWDVLFLDVCIPVPEGMIQLFKFGNMLKEQGAVTLLDLSDKAFASAASYIVNKNSINKLAHLLQKQDQINIPIDLLYKQLIYSGEIKAFVTFPFLTSLSSLSEKSDLQSQDSYQTELIWHTFRKLIWNQSRREDYQENLEILKNQKYNQAEEDFSILLKGFINKQFLNK